MSARTITVDHADDVEIGDLATIEGPRKTLIRGYVTDVQYDSGVWSIYLDLGVMGHSTHFNVGQGCDKRLVSATREVPDYTPGTTDTQT